MVDASSMLAAEPLLRFATFAGVLALMAGLELFLPRRAASQRKPVRWLHNLGLVALNTLALRLLVPLGAVGAALLAEEHGWGLLNLFALPPWLTVLAAVVLLDLVIYLQHILFHAVPVLWRLHRVHHADLDFDVTTGLRFHPVEILLSMGLKMAVVLLLGVPALAVLLFEILLNATSMFNHANARLPRWLDRTLRLFLVTPDMHRVHHSVLRPETNSNFGFNLPWWDYLFGTYKAQPERGHEGMTIGVEEFREEREVGRLPGMLLLPFKGDGERTAAAPTALEAERRSSREKSASGV